VSEIKIGLGGVEKAEKSHLRKVRGK